MEIISYNGGKKKRRTLDSTWRSNNYKKEKKKVYKKNQEHMQPLLNTTLTGRRVYASHQCTRPPPNVSAPFQRYSIEIHWNQWTLSVGDSKKKRKKKKTKKKTKLPQRER